VRRRRAVRHGTRDVRSVTLVVAKFARQHLGSAGERMASRRAQQQARRSLMQLDQQLLEHEQLHFDIAEANVRRIRARFAEFKNVCADPDGTAPVQAMIARADRELQEEQQRYDRETGHGINARAQEQWKLRIRALLK
jgi:predicted secreted Zn-dependent protease